MIDELYTLVVAQIGVTQATRANKPKRAKGPNHQTGRKRKRKRFRYARTQDLFRKNPNLLARYIREGTPWLEDEDYSSPKPEDVKSFYAALLGTLPEIKIPFTVDGPGHIARDIGDVLQAITSRDIHESLNHTRQNTDPGADGIQRKHIAGLETKEVLRILFNIILVRSNRSLGV